MENPYLDYIAVRETLAEYASPRSHLSYMSRKGKLIRVRRGLYVPQDTTGISLMTLANKIYGPSYISFESALAYHGLIPERAQTVTSASMGKNKNKIFNTPLGVFSYRSVPADIFPYGVQGCGEDNAPFLIASPEKALCDLLVKAGSAVPNELSFENFLLNDLRIEPSNLTKLRMGEISVLEKLYAKRSVTILAKYLKHKRRPLGSS